MKSDRSTRIPLVIAYFVQSRFGGYSGSSVRFFLQARSNASGFQLNICILHTIIRPSKVQYLPCTNRWYWNNPGRSSSLLHAFYTLLPVICVSYLEVSTSSCYSAVNSELGHFIPPISMSLDWDTCFSVKTRCWQAYLMERISLSALGDCPSFKKKIPPLKIWFHRMLRPRYGIIPMCSFYREFHES